MAQPRVNWVATPPPGRPVPPPPARRVRYLGPPSYQSTPRWGFPALAWRWPTSVPGTRTRPPATVERVRTTARQATVALWAMAGGALLGAGSELWRYVLLLDSRTGALPRRLVEASDALVVTGSVLSIAFAVLAGGLTMWWLLQARGAAADLAGHDPARPEWQVLYGVFIPGMNLVVPGAALAELEHMVLRRRPERRVRPSRLVLAWWLTWVLSCLLFLTTLLWRLRSGVQAQSDGVLINVFSYLVAVAVAVLTVFVIRRLCTLLTPVAPETVRFMHVIKVEGAPPPPLRPGRPTGSVR